MSSRNKSTAVDEPRQRTSSTSPGEAIDVPADRVAGPSAIDDGLSTRRLNVMRFGYAFIALGLAIVKWPILIQQARSLPLFEGIVTALLTAMSLLALLGLRYPARMLPILLFEVTWKLIWIAAVALPHVIANDVDSAFGGVLFNCSLVVVILAVIPWRYTWRRYVRAPGDAWR